MIPSLIEKNIPNSVHTKIENCKNKTNILIEYSMAYNIFTSYSYKIQISLKQGEKAGNK